MPSMSGHAMTGEEAVRYDRQMRLWGVDAQVRMMQAKVLLVNLGGVGAEVAKNLVLGGVGAVDLVDAAAVSTEDLGRNFLLGGDSVGKNRAAASVQELQSMNGLVQLKVLGELPSDDALKGYAMVIATDMQKAAALPLAASCRTLGVPVLLCCSFGLLSFSFADFGADFTTVVTDPTNKSLKQEHTVAFPAACHVFAETTSWAKAKPLPSFVASQVLWEVGPLRDMAPGDVLPALKAANARFAQQHSIQALSDDFLEQLAAHCIGDLSPVCAIAGGIYAQEVLKVVQRNAKAMLNFFVYDALLESKGYCEKVE
eukprot:TRINITY_DN6111_c0_g1_i7.p2 TRINITY_DN6111_c0_g1~~TRINITY_DN6111_c0_g1_i7.p2  ORF type:complete len:313 (+),score=101.42 TRINITY_DN6111_c0_g1_i7:64-1002(+)